MAPQRSGKCGTVWECFINQVARISVLTSRCESLSTYNTLLWISSTDFTMPCETPHRNLTWSPGLYTGRRYLRGTCKAGVSSSVFWTRTANVKKQPSQDVLHGDEAEEELGLARLVSSYTLPHQNSQPGGRGRQTARSKVLSRRARDT